MSFLSLRFPKFETYLKNTTLPYADNLLVEVQRDKEKALEGQGMNKNTMVEAGNMLREQGADSSKANPQTMELANKFIGRE